MVQSTLSACLAASVLLALVGCGSGTQDHGLAEMVEWSDECCEEAWSCVISTFSADPFIADDEEFKLLPPNEPYQPGAQQDFLVSSAKRRFPVQWTERSVTYRTGDFEPVSLPLWCDATARP